MCTKFVIIGEKIPVVDSGKHLGNFISLNIVGRNITENVCDLYKRSNWVIVTSEYVIAAPWIVCI